MSIKHTPHPWKLKRVKDDEGQTMGHGIYGANGDAIIFIDTPQYTHYEEIEANLRLMTASPKLLAALEGLVSDMEEEQASGVEEGIYEDEEREDITQLKLLIAEAK